MNQPASGFPGDEAARPFERPSPLPGVTWNLRDVTLGVFGALLVFFILGGGLVGAFVAAFGEDAIETMLAEAAAVAILDLVLVGTALFVIRRKGAGLEALGWRAPRQGWAKMLGFIVVAYVVAIMLVNLYGIVVEASGLDELEPAPQLEDDFFDHTSVVVLTGFVIVFMAPVAEEIFFRGFIFGGLRRYMNLPIAGLLSGALFSLAHGDPGLIAPFAAVGLVLAFVYERTGSLFTSIGVHFVFNSISFALLLFFPELR